MAKRKRKGRGGEGGNGGNGEAPATDATSAGSKNGGDDAEGKARKVRRPATPKEVAWEWAKSLGTAFILYLIIKTFLLQTFVITSASMRDTLLVGDFLILTKAAYGAKVPFTERARLPGYSEPHHGDVAVFRPPHDPDLDVVKRIMGLPGDTLMMRDKQLYRNGVALDEPYVRHTDFGGDVGHPWMRWQCGEDVHLSPDISGQYRVAPRNPADTTSACNPTRDNWGPIVVPPGHTFMMGDNRDDSIDSRYWGFLDMSKLIGRASIIYYSYDSEALEPFRWVTAVRWSRIGDRIR